MADKDNEMPKGGNNSTPAAVTRTAESSVRAATAGDTETTSKTPGTGPISDEPKDAVDAGRAVLGTSSATGQERLRRAGEEEERISNLEDRGAEVRGAEQDSMVADYNGQNVQEPVGAMAEDARFLGNGTVPVGVLPSNSGFVPASAVVAGQEDAERLLESHQKSVENQQRTLYADRKELTDDEIGRMGGAELRAVAHDRGYQISDALGTRGVRTAFRNAQSKDDHISRQSKDSSDKR
jgi:hypothetical protein